MEEEIEKMITKKASLEEENKKLKEAVAQHVPRQNRASNRQMANVSYSYNNAQVQSLMK